MSKNNFWAQQKPAAKVQKKGTNKPAPKVPVANPFAVIDVEEDKPEEASWEDAPTVKPTNGAKKQTASMLFENEESDPIRLTLKSARNNSDGFDHMIYGEMVEKFAKKDPVFAKTVFWDTTDSETMDEAIKRAGAQLAVYESGRKSGIMMEEVEPSLIGHLTDNKLAHVLGYYVKQVAEETNKTNALFKSTTDWGFEADLRDMLKFEEDNSKLAAFAASLPVQAPMALIKGKAPETAQETFYLLKEYSPDGGVTWYEKPVTTFNKDIVEAALDRYYNDFGMRIPNITDEECKDLQTRITNLGRAGVSIKDKEMKTNLKKFNTYYNTFGVISPSCKDKTKVPRVRGGPTSQSGANAVDINVFHHVEGKFAISRGERMLVGIIPDLVRDLVHGKPASLFDKVQAVSFAKTAVKIPTKKNSREVNDIYQIGWRIRVYTHTPGNTVNSALVKEVAKELADWLEFYEYDRNPEKNLVINVSHCFKA